MANKNKRKRASSPSPAYAPPKRKRATSTPADLPVSEDWSFRLKVLSSAADLDGDVLQDAVQGLVRICFPEGVLDELGVDIVAAHMVQNGASLRSIDRTKAMFNEAMIHRMAEMIAPYVDTPQKLDDGIAAVIAAAKRLHGRGPGLQDEELNSRAAGSALEDEIESLVPREDSPQEEALPHTRLSKKTLDRRSSENHYAQTPDLTADMPRVTSREQQLIELPDATAEDHESHNKIDKKVSKSWRWDVE